MDWRIYSAFPFLWIGRLTRLFLSYGLADLLGFSFLMDWQINSAFPFLWIGRLTQLFLSYGLAD